MKLKNLYIKKYKNLIDFTIDFQRGNGLSMLVGNNGSGKSNLLEAISGIFHDLFRQDKGDRKIDCDYSLEYELDGIDCKLEQVNGTLRCYGEKFKRRDQFIDENAPNNIIGLYSGEEDRLWTQFYEHYYKTYMRRIKENQYQGRMKLVFINKYYWNIALLTLLLSSNDTLKPFIENDLGIRTVDEVVLTYNFHNYEQANNLLKAFIDRINPEHKVRQKYSIDDLKQAIFYDFWATRNGEHIVDSNGTNILVNSGITDVDVFRFLTQGCMPKDSKVISNISIIMNGGITVQQLSEGEKKLILVKAVLEILADEKSLILMDEPDAHLHETRKKSLYEMMLEYPNRQIVLATHSPTFIDIADQEQICMIKSSETGEASIFTEDKVEAIRHLTGSRYNAFLEQPILYCEGTETSVEYRLYPILFPDYKIIPSGGHDEVINNTKMYNRTLGDAAHHAIGIIDWDYRTEEQIATLKSNRVYSLHVVEIENVLMDLILLHASKEQFCAAEDGVDLVKEELFRECATSKERQAKKYTANRIVSKIKDELTPDGRDIEVFKEKIAQLCDPTKVDDLYTERLQCLEKYIQDGCFEELVTIYDFNHNIDRFLKSLSNDYLNKIIRLIGKRSDLQTAIKEKYYADIPLT